MWLPRRDSGESSPPPPGTLPSRFTSIASRGAHTSRRRSHTAVARSQKVNRVRSITCRRGGRPWPRATCERRDHRKKVNQVRRRSERRRRLYRHGRARQLSTETILGCRTDHPRRRRTVRPSPEGLIFRGVEPEPRAGSPAAPTRRRSNSSSTSGLKSHLTKWRSNRRRAAAPARSPWRARTCRRRSPRLRSRSAPLPRASLAAERQDVVRDVRGAADAVHLVIERDHGHRSFR